MFFVDGGDNRTVGFVTAAMGGAQVATAPLVGFLVDRWRRQTMVRAAAVAGVVCAAVNAAAFATLELRWLWAGAALGGVYQGIANPSVKTLLTDSTRPGPERSGVFANAFVVRALSKAVAPLLSLALFAALGDRWHLPTLRVVLLVGVALLLVPCCLCLFMRDEDAVDGLEHQPAPARAAADAPKGDLEQPLLAAEAAPPAASVRVCGVALGVAAIPWIVATSDFIIASGAGMTVQFFPLFFVNVYSLRPTQLMGVYVAMYVVVGLSGWLAKQANKRHKAGAAAGRCAPSRAAIAVVTGALGTACLACMVIVAPWFVDIPLFLLRTGLMNSSGPLQRALMMDAAKPEDRGKWNAAESLTAFTWTGSAAVGGLLVHQHGYRFAFGITAVFYVVGVLGLTPLLRLQRLLLPAAARGSGGKQ